MLFDNLLAIRKFLQEHPARPLSIQANRKDSQGIKDTGSYRDRIIRNIDNDPEFEEKLLILGFKNTLDLIKTDKSNWFDILI